MAKGYWIGRVDVHNMDGYKQYVAENGPVFKKYGAGSGARRQVREQGRVVTLAQRGDRFKDYDTALACYNSPEYARLVEMRKLTARALSW